MYRGGYKHVARAAGLLALLCAALVNVSCDALGNVKFPGDFVAGLEEARTTKITFYDKNPIENPGAKSAFRRYKFEYEFNINTEYPEELCPGGIPEEWKYIDFENPSAPPPVNVSVDSNGKIQTVYVTQRELCFYVSSWHTHSFAAEWESDATHHWHNATCGHDLTDGLAEHDWNVVVINEPTQEDDGEEKHTCNVCGKTKIVAIPALGHVHTFDTTTWEKDATHHWHAATCRHTDVKGDLAAHVWGVTSTAAATCETEGTTNYICVCGATKTETIPATGHTFATTWEKDATHHWHECSVCNAIDDTSKAEHTWSGDTCTVCEKKKTNGLKPDEVADYLAECAANGTTDVSIAVDFTEVSTADTLANLQTIRDAIRKYNSNFAITSVDLELTGIKEIPNATSSSDGAFYYCLRLKSVKLPDDLESIGSYAFANCSGLTSVTIPNKVTTIGDLAFSDCSGLESVTIPNSVTSIGLRVFSGCSGLASVTIPDSVTSIGYGAFSGCSGLTTVTIPDSVTSIGNYAFQNCSGLTSVTIPTSVTSIGQRVFYGCSGLTSVTIGSGVTEIGVSAFSGCSGLTSVTIPTSVTSIGGRAFQSCSGLTSVTIGSGVTEIGAYAFSGCSGLASVTIPDSVTVISNEAFSGCSGLTSVTIGSGVTSIGESAFSGCSGLTSVTIGNSVTSIGRYAFYDCSELESVTVRATTPPTLGSSAFSNNKSGRKIYVPAGSVDAYKAASGWSDYASYIEAIP